MKSILILGASNLQLPIIKYVKESGYNVIVVSIPGSYPGFKYADKCVYKDIRDIDGIYEAVTNEEIAAVLTDETDIAVPTVASLAKKLCVAGNDPCVAECYSNKYLMREACKSVHVPIPNYIRATSITEIKENISAIRFPAIMKPEDNQGSRGIFIVSSMHEIENNIKNSLKYSTSGHVIIEDYFEGKEVVCEGFVINGKYLNWGIAERKYFKIKDKLIPCQTIFPAVISNEMRNKILLAEENIHSYLKPSFGMIHSEYIINDKTGNFILVETALRGGGVYISSHLIPEYTGIDNYKLLLGCALGKSFELKEIRKNIKTRASAYMCFYLPEGTITSIKGQEEILSLDFVRMANINDLFIGQKTSKLENKTHRLGPIILTALNRAILKDNMETVKKILDIKVKTNKGNIESIKWE